MLGQRPISSLLKNLIFQAFSFSVLSFRRVVRECFGFFYLPSRLVEAKCHVLAIRFRNRHRLWAPPVKVNSHPILSIPRNFTFLSIAAHSLASLVFLPSDEFF